MRLFSFSPRMRMAAALPLSLCALAACTPATKTASTAPVAQQGVKAAELLHSQAQKATDDRVAEASLAKAVVLYDDAALQDPEVEKSQAFTTLVSDYTAVLTRRAADATLPAEERGRLLAMARFAAERQPSEIAAGHSLLAVARQQINTGDYAGSADTLTAGLLKIGAVDVQKRDPLTADMARLLAHSVRGRSRAAVWAEGVENQDLRVAVLSDIARVQVTTGDIHAPELASFIKASAADLDSGSSELLQAAEALRVRADLRGAAVTAMAARIGTPGRDSLLETLVQEARSNEDRDAVELAAFGVSAKAMREDALFQLALGNASDSRVTIAERLNAELTDSTHKAQVESRIALDYASSHVSIPARAAMAAAVQSSSFFMPRAAKSLVNNNLALAYLRFGETTKAMEFANRVTDRTARVDLMAELARKSTDTSDWDAAQHAVNEVRNAGDRLTAARLKASLLAAQDHPDQLEHLAAGLNRPAERAWTLAYTVAAATKHIDTARVDRAFGQLIALRRQKMGLSDAQQVAAASATAYAMANQPQVAEAYLPDAIADNDDGYLMAVAETASAWARQHQNDGVRNALSLTLNDDQESKVLQRVTSTYAKAGDFPTAANFAKMIPAYKDRVRTMHQLAMDSADDLDVYKVLDGQPGARPGRVDDDRQAILTGAAVTYYNIGNQSPGQALPPLPPLKRFTRQMVSDTIPATKDGQVFVIPIQYSDYNTKFIANLNNAFRSIGGQIFPVQAQGTRYPRYIHIDSGVYTLESLSRRLTEIGYADALVRKGTRYQLNLPLLVGPKASLVISGTDAQELRLNSVSGVFIVTAGKLWFHDVVVAGWDPVQKTYPQTTFATRAQFRPFIIAWGGSVMNADGTHFHHLGFSGAKGYGFSYSQGPILVQKSRPGLLNRPTGSVVENVFEQQYFGFFTNAADDVALIGNEYKNNIIYGVDPHDFSRRLIIAYNVSYGASKKHGIIGSREVNDSFVVGNVVFDNHGTGIMIDRISMNNVVYANRVWNNGQEGVALYESPCNIVAGNTAWGNHGDTVKVRNSTDVGIFSNTLSTTDRAGVNIYVGDPKQVPGFPLRDTVKDPYVKYVTVSVLDNKINKNNGAGILATGYGAVAIKGNQFFGAQRKLLQGDLAPLAPELIRLHGEGVVARSTCPAITVPKTCRFVTLGYLKGLVDNLPASQGSRATCVGAPDPDQETDNTDGEGE